MQSIFNITSIIGDYSNKTITITTTFTVDKTTVNKKNVEITDASSGTTVIYKLSVDDKNIIITLKDWPLENSSYQVNVKDIKDMLGRDLVNPLTKMIIFKADTKLKVNILTPINNEGVIAQHNLVYFAIEQLNPDGTTTVNKRPQEAIVEVESDVKYQFEFASDIAFFNVVKSITSQYTDGYIQLDNNQYYFRARVIENNQPSDWSDTITFTIIPETCSDADELLSDAQKQYLDEVLAPIEFFLDDKEDISIVSRTTNGNTESEFYIEFNTDIDLESLPEKIIAYRRDL